MNDTLETLPAARLGKLKPLQQQAIFEHCNAVPLEEAVRWLETEHGLQIGTNRLAAWLRRQRAKRSGGALTRKTRPDCKLGVLPPEQQEAIFAHCESVTLQEGARWLVEEHHIRLCTHNLGVWLRKRRILNSVAPRLDAIRDARDRAMLIGSVIGSSTEITDVNSALISQAVFEEFMKPAGERDEKQLIQYMKLALSARVSELASERFRFDIAKKATEHTDKLQEIKRGGGDEREKIEKAIEVLFGKEPSKWVVDEPGTESLTPVEKAEGPEPVEGGNA